MSQFFTSGSQSIGVLASASVLPMNIQDWFPLGWTGWISLQSKGLSRVLQHYNLKASILQHSPFFMVHLSHLYMSTGKTIALTRWTFVSKVMSLLFNTLSLSQFFFQGASVFFNFIAAVTILSDYGAQENKICHWFHFSPVYLLWSDGTGCHDLLRRLYRWQISPWKIIPHHMSSRKCKFKQLLFYQNMYNSLLE